MLFYSFRYRFWLPRYRRVKKRLIFNRLRSLSLSLIRTSRSRLVSLTYPKRQLRFLEKKVGQCVAKSINRLRAVLNITKTLNPYISATVWDIGIKQKGISTVCFPLSSMRISITKFSIFFNFFFTWKFNLRDCYDRLSCDKIYIETRFT